MQDQKLKSLEERLAKLQPTSSNSNLVKKNTSGRPVHGPTKSIPSKNIHHR